MSAPEAVFTTLTYNIHRCHGTDGRYDPYRVAQLLCEIDADVVGLQEVDTSLMVPLCERRHERPLALGERPGPADLPAGQESCGDLHQLDFLASQTRCRAVEGLVRVRGDGEFGNAILTRHDIKDVRRIDLTVRGASEKRGALDVDLVIRGQAVRVVVTHLGLQLWERHFQVARLIKALGEDRGQRIVMMGDFNLLLSVLPKLRRFYRRLGHTPHIATFPSWFPMASLDRIWIQPAERLQQIRRVDTPLSRVASDHLPLLATVALSE